MTQNKTEQLFQDAIRQSRDDALEAAIGICELIYVGGGGALGCVNAIKKLKDELPRPEVKLGVVP